MLTAEVGGLHPGLVLLHDRYELPFRVPLLPFIVSEGQPPISSGSIQGSDNQLNIALFIT
jgi:hypothetical protein